MIVSTHPQAQEEIVDGASFYAKEADVSLGEAFIGEFSRASELLAEHPKLGARWRGIFRRLPLRRFPYSIVYYETAAAIRIVAVAHQSRRPGYWRGRL